MSDDEKGLLELIKTGDTSNIKLAVIMSSAEVITDLFLNEIIKNKEFHVGPYNYHGDYNASRFELGELFLSFIFKIGLDAEEITLDNIKVLTNMSFTTMSNIWAHPLTVENYRSYLIRCLNQLINE